MSGPRDSIVKALFANTEDAVSALASALLPEVAEHIAWDSLAHANLNLVDQKLREVYTDIVLTARRYASEVFLYVPLEHRSTHDPLMAFWLLRHIVQIWDVVLPSKPGCSNCSRASRCGLVEDTPNPSKPASNQHHSRDTLDRPPEPQHSAGIRLKVACWA